MLNDKDSDDSDSGGGVDGGGHLQGLPCEQHVVVDGDGDGSNDARSGRGGGNNGSGGGGDSDGGGGDNAPPLPDAPPARARPQRRASAPNGDLRPHLPGAAAQNGDEATIRSLTGNACEGVDQMQVEPSCEQLTQSSSSKSLTAAQGACGLLMSCMHSVSLQS